MTPDKREGPDYQQSLTTFSNQIATALGIQPENLGRSIKSAQHFLFEGGRYCCLINGPINNETGFIKIAHAPDLVNVQNLTREAFVAQHAQALGIPAVGCLTPPMEVGKDYLLIQLEVLSPKDGINYLGKEMHASAPPKVAALAANAILSLNRKPVPDQIDTSFLDRNHERNSNLDSFNKVWQKQNDTVFTPEYQEIVSRQAESSPDENDGENNLHHIVDTAQNYLGQLITNGQDDTHEYLSHGDADLNNMFFRNNGEVVLIDWETATATHNWFLAQLTDLSNLYGRFWVDPEKQRQVLSTIINSDSFDDLQTRYQVAYTVAVFGAMYLAKYGMDPTHHEHQMSLSLLGHLQENLDYLNSEYQSLSQTQSSGSQEGQ